jgi:hypothetical protein
MADLKRINENWERFSEAQKAELRTRLTPEEKTQLVAMRKGGTTAPVAQAEPKSRQISREVLQGLSFGFGDEMTAGINAGIDMLTKGGSYGENYSRNVEAERAALARNRQEFPVQSVASNIAGGLPLALVPGLNAAKATTTGRAILNGAKAGAATGALAGFGAGEGGVTERLPGAAAGGAVGGLFGGAIPAVGAAVRGTRNLLAPAQVKADRKILNTLAQDQLTPEDLGPRLDAFGQKPATIADAAGDNTRGLTDAAFLGPSAARPAAREVLEKRAAEQSGRILQDLAETSGTSADRFKTVAQLRQIREEAAAPLYAEAYEAGRAQVASPELQAILGTPAARAAYGRARAIAANERRVLPELYVNTPVKEATGLLDASGRALTKTTEKATKVQNVVDLETLDKVKQAIDARITDAKSPLSSISTAERRALNTVRRDLLTAMDREFPGYAAARAAFAGPARMEEALQAGAEFAKKDAREIAAELAEEFTSKTDRQYYLIGAMDALRQRGLNDVADGADSVKRVFGSPEKRAQIRTLFPSAKAFAEFEKRMAQEKTLRATQDFIRGNSRTAQRLTEQADAAGEVVTSAASLAKGNPIPAGAGILSRLGVGRVDADNLLPTLMNTSPQANRASLLRLTQQRQLDALARRGGLLAPALAGGYAGQFSGGLLRDGR